MRVANISDQYQFVSDSQSVQAIREYLGIDSDCDYNSFFVLTVQEIDWFKFAGLSPEHVLESIQGITFLSVWALEGIVPWTHKFLDELYPI